MRHDPLTEQIIGACYTVHSALGPGFTEKVYQEALKVALKRSGLDVQPEQSFEVTFDGNSVGRFRADLVVGGRAIVEVKAVDNMMPKVYETQVISYLKASGLGTGLLVNFGRRSCEVRRLMNERGNHRNRRMNEEIVKA